jgi:hypothetical protein
MTSTISLQFLSDADQASLSGGHGRGPNGVHPIVASTNFMVNLKQVCALGDDLMAKAEDIKEIALDYTKLAKAYTC